MAAATQNMHIPDIIEITKDDDGQLIGISPTTDNDNPTSNPKTSNPVERHGLDNPETSTLPTCCPRYPPGSTLLECRFEGDQPVANVVQVPGCANKYPKTCFLLETQASRSGPTSRIACYPQKDPIKSVQKHSSCEEEEEEKKEGAGKMSMAYTLESRECSDGPFARAIIIPSEESAVNSSNKVTSLHVCKGKNHPAHPTSKIIYGPRLDGGRKTKCDEVEEKEEPVSFIGCTAGKKHATARITKCHHGRNEGGNGATPFGAKRCLETHVPRNTDRPTAHAFVLPLDKPAACHHSTMEAKVDECGPRTRMVSYPHEDNFTGYMESRNVEDGPAARIMQQSLDTVDEGNGLFEGGRAVEDGKLLCRTSSGCATSCARQQLRCEGKPAAAAKRREEGVEEGDKCGKTSRQYPRGKVCPTYCCKPTAGQRPKSCMIKYDKDCRKPEQPPACPPAAERPRTCTTTTEKREKRREAAAPKSKTYKFLIVPCTIVGKTEAPADADDCTRPKEKKERLDCGEERVEKVECEEEEEEEIPKISSEELLTRYRDYFSPNTLHRYEVCRSKRNGLQDQCKLPIPRAVIELKMKELRCRKKK